MVKLTPKNFIRPAIVVLLILLVPLIAMQYSEEVKWGFFDFVFAGIVLYVFSLAMEFSLKKFTTTSTRILAVLVILLTLILFWGAVVANLGERVLEQIFCDGVC